MLRALHDRMLQVWRAKEDATSGASPTVDLFDGIASTFSTRYGASHPAETATLLQGSQRFRQTVNGLLNDNQRHRIKAAIRHSVKSFRRIGSRADVDVVLSIENTSSKTIADLALRLIGRQQESELSYDVVGADSHRWDTLPPNAQREAPFRIQLAAADLDYVLLTFDLRLERGGVSLDDGRTYVQGLQTERPAAVPPPEAKASPRPYEGVRPGLPPLFVDRADLLREARRIFDADGPANTLIFFGPAKIGKSALLHKLRHDYSESGGRQGTGPDAGSRDARPGGQADSRRR